VLNKVIMACRRLWRYSLTERRWTYRRLIRDQFTPQYMSNENMAAFYDEATRELLVSSAGSEGIYRATGYNLVSNQWTNWSSPWNLSSAIADTRVGRRAVVVEAPATAAGGYRAQPGRYWDYNLDSRSVTATDAMQFADGLQLSDFPPANWFYDSAALTYIASRNRFWFYTLMLNNSMQLIEIDPTTTPWTARRAPALAGNVPVPGRQMERKLIYLPMLNAVLLCDAAAKDMWLYRF